MFFVWHDLSHTQLCVVFSAVLFHLFLCDVTGVLCGMM